METSFAGGISLNIQSARRLTGGDRAAYEVRVEGIDTPLVAVIEKTGETYRVHSIYENDASLEIDGYENSEHDAYIDISAQWVGEDEHRLAENILGKAGFQSTSGPNPSIYDL